MNWFQTYNPVSAFISVTRAVLCILNFVTRCCVSLYQCCLGESVCAEAKHVEGFLTLCINNSTLTGNKILLHGPSQWVWGHPRVVQKPTFSTAGVRALSTRGTSLRDYTVRKMVPWDCAVIGSIISELGQNTLIVVKSSRIPMQHLRLLPTSFFKTCSVTFICKKKVTLKKFHYSLTTVKHNLFPSRAQCRAI